MKDQYEKLLGVYNSTTVFRNETLQSFSNNDVAIFKRKLNTEEYLIVVNVRNTIKNVTLDASLQNTSWTNALDGSAATLSTSVSLQPYEYRILKK